jgi:hypothetical protein
MVNYSGVIPHRRFRTVNTLGMSLVARSLFGMYIVKKENLFTSELRDVFKKTIHDGYSINNSLYDESLNSDLLVSRICLDSLFDFLIGEIYPMRRDLFGKYAFFNGGKGHIRESLSDGNECRYGGFYAENCYEEKRTHLDGMVVGVRNVVAEDHITVTSAIDFFDDSVSMDLLLKRLCTN